MTVRNEKGVGLCLEVFGQKTEPPVPAQLTVDWPTPPIPQE